jgi:hypothetical protein
MDVQIDGVARLREGACILLFAYDIGQGIDFERARQAIGSGGGRRFRHVHAPSCFQFYPRRCGGAIGRMPAQLALRIVTKPLVTQPRWRRRRAGALARDGPVPSAAVSAGDRTRPAPVRRTAGPAAIAQLRTDGGRCRRIVNEATQSRIAREQCFTSG